MGELTDTARDNPDVVKRLWEAAVMEFERRGADPAVVHWLRGKGEETFPERYVPHRFYPPPSGYRAYFSRLYHGDFPGG